MDVREVSVNECGRQMKSWLIEEQHLAPNDAGRRMWIARRLPAHPELTEALVTGDINHEHVHLILGCLAKLPADWRDAAEAELLTFAREHDPGMLAALCRELRVRTGADEDAEAAAQHKYDSRFLTITDTFEGTARIDGMLDPESAATLRAALAPLIVPTVDDSRTSGQRHADALIDLARLALDFGGLPDHCGERPHVIVTIPYNELRDGLASGQVGNAKINGQSVTPATARMIACDANIIPAVLSGRSEILDLGRSQRHWNTAQRRARRLADQGCTWPGCQAPLERCRIHHLDYWANGGHTNLTNGTHICQFHHWLVHHTNWTITRNTDGKIEISRT
jgi:hypothetical protein